MAHPRINMVLSFHQAGPDTSNPPPTHTQKEVGFSSLHFGTKPHVLYVLYTYTLWDKATCALISLISLQNLSKVTFAILKKKPQ